MRDARRRLTGLVGSSLTPETDVVSVADRQIVGKVTQASPFCPNIAAIPNGSQVWFTLKDIGKTQVFDGRPPFTLLKTLDTGIREAEAAPIDRMPRMRQVWLGRR